MARDLWTRDDNIDKGETPGDSWSDAMSRRSVWDE